MIVSPCGWFCLEEPEGWNVLNTPDSIIMKHEYLNAFLEITSARKEHVINENDVFEMQDKLTHSSKLPIQNTSLQTLSNGVECIHTILSDQQRVVCPVFLYWGHYCIRIILECPVDPNTNIIFDDLKSILNMLQPMTID